MKKILLLILAVCLLFLAAGCGTGQPAREPEAAQTPVPEAETEPAPASETEAEPLPASEEKAEPRTVGMVAVCGKPEAEPGVMIYTEWSTEKGIHFPLDAAMLFDVVEENKTTSIGSQNTGCRSIHVSTAADYDLLTGEEKNTRKIMASGTAKYNSAIKKEFTIYTYDVGYDGERAWFDPLAPNQVYTLNSGDEISVTFRRAECELTMAGAVPTVSLTVTCLQGETELWTETLQAEEMDAYLKYPLPEGTDRVDVVYFDAGGGIIGEESLQKFGGSFDVWYDIGGFFLGHKTLSPEWK